MSELFISAPLYFYKDLTISLNVLQSNHLYLC